MEIVALSFLIMCLQLVGDSFGRSVSQENYCRCFRCRYMAVNRLPLHGS